jgi:cytochrome P450
MSTPIIDEAAKVFTDPSSYADEPRLHAALTYLRAHAPVSLVDCPPYRPFWAITKHADIMEIERANDLFINEPRPLLATAKADDVAREQLAAGMGLRTLIHMDDPQHRVVRAIGADWFRPKAMRALKRRVDELAKIYVDKMMAAGNTCDFVQEVAVNYPLYVIMSLLGLPESDFPRMLTLTQEMFGGDDAEFRRGTTLDEQLQVLFELFGYFNALTAARREHPTEDLASAIANACVDGEPLSDVDTASYYVIIASAGHDTTSATIAGGLQALIDNPDQRKRLRDNLDLMPRTPRWAGFRSPQARRCTCHMYPVTVTRRCSITRPASTWAVIPTNTWRSVMGCTSVWAPRWPEWKSTASSPNCYPGSHRSSWTDSQSSSRRRSSAVSSTCRSVTSFLERVILRAMDVQEAVHGSPRAFAIVEVGQGGQPPQHHRAHQQRDRP